MSHALRAVVVVAAMTVASLVPATAHAATTSQFPLRATVYDARSGAPVNLVGRLRAGTDVSGSQTQGWTVTLAANLDTVTGTSPSNTLRYSATGAASVTRTFAPGPLPASMVITPSYSLRPPSPAKAQTFQLMLVATLSATGRVTAIEVRSPAPPVAFSVDPGLRPDVATVPGPDGTAPRPVVRLADSLGSAMDFVANELTLTTDDPAVLAGFLQRWNGVELRTIVPPDGTTAAVHVVRVDPSRADLSRLKADVTSLDPTAHGPHRASSDGALRLFAAAVSEQAAGLRVGLNSLHAPQAYIDRRTLEAPAGDNDPASNTAYDSNSAEWSYFESGGTSNFGVTEAWRILEVGGRLANRVRIGVIDVGCASDER